jgi:hypothetical protein
VTIDQQLRDQLDRATQDVPVLPDLDAAISSGRARRRRRAAAMAGGGVAGVAIAGLSLAFALGGSTSPGSQVATEAGASDGSYVTGTTIDEDFAAVVARHLPALGEPTDVYPSDWDHRGPMPDTDFSDATDWQATYTLSRHDDLLIIMGYDEPGSRSAQHRKVTNDSYNSGGEYTFFTEFATGSGFSVNAIQTVTADSYRDAVSRRVLSPAQLRALVTDPALTFPFPDSRR